MLLKKGANVNAKNDQGKTALFEAVNQEETSKNYADVVRMLLEHGADAKIRDTEGQTVLDIVSEKGHTEIEKLIRNYTKY